MKTTKRCKNIPLIVSLVVMLAVLAPSSATPGTGPAGVAEASGLSAAPVAYCSNEARRAIVPAGPGGVFGPENYGNKFPGEAAVYMGTVHVAIYAAALAFEGGYQSYAISITTPPNASAPAAIATAAHHTLVGM